MKPFDVAGAKKRCEAATSGPWAYTRRTHDPSVRAFHLDAGPMGRNIASLAYLAPEEDGEFIAAARTDLPAALELLEAATSFAIGPIEVWQSAPGGYWYIPSKAQQGEPVQMTREVALAEAYRRYEELKERETAARAASENTKLSPKH